MQNCNGNLPFTFPFNNHQDIYQATSLLPQMSIINFIVSKLTQHRWPDSLTPFWRCQSQLRSLQFNASDAWPGWWKRHDWQPKAIENADAASFIPDVSAEHPVLSPSSWWRGDSVSRLSRWWIHQGLELGDKWPAKFCYAWSANGVQPGLSMVNAHRHQ